MHSKAAFVFFNYGLYCYLSIISSRILQNSWLNQENLYEVKNVKSIEIKK